MPTYDYTCDACGHRGEIFQSITDKPLKKCPACGRKTLRRLIGAGAGILFHGSGFYETDYRSESYKSEARKDREKTKSESGGDGASAPKTSGDQPAPLKRNKKTAG